MKSSLIKISIAFVAAVILLLTFYSCKKETSCENCNSNRSPVANAGIDQVIYFPADSVRLDGSTSTDPDGTISSWGWTKISGPAPGNVVSPATAITMVRNLDTGAYRFRLMVTDNRGVTDADTVEVKVLSGSSPLNRPPVANAGTDQTITLPVNSVNLDGSGSADPDNNISSYLWTKISGPAFFNIANANTIQTQATNLVEGVYQFELKVTDAGGLFDRDTVFITVNIAGNNPDVYIAGWGLNTNNKRVARIWRNNIVQDLTDGQHDAEATSVFVSGTDVYVAGLELIGGNARAMLWKNGVVQNLNNTQGISQANAVFVSGSDVYVAGSILNSGGSGDAILWKNGVVQTLSNGQNGMAVSIYVADNDVYVAGFRDPCAPGGCLPEAILWKNGVAQSLTNGQYSRASSVFVSGSDVYVAGDRTDSAKLWKNGVMQNLSSYSYLSIAHSVFVIGSDVFVAGANYNCVVGGCADAMLWKNGQEQILQQPLGSVVAYSVFVNGGNVYVAGEANSTGTLWKNGIAYSIQGLFAANSVFVK